MGDVSVFLSRIWQSTVEINATLSKYGPKREQIEGEEGRAEEMIPVGAPHEEQRRIQEIKISWSAEFLRPFISCDLMFLFHQVHLSDCIYEAIHLNLTCMCILSLLHNRIRGGWKDVWKTPSPSHEKIHFFKNIQKNWNVQRKWAFNRLQVHANYIFAQLTKKQTITGTHEGFQSSETTENNTPLSFNCGQKLPIVTNPSIKVEMPQGHIFVRVDAIFSSILSIQCDISVQKPGRFHCYKMSRLPKEQWHWHEDLLQETRNEMRQYSIEYLY